MCSSRLNEDGGFSYPSESPSVIYKRYNLPNGSVLELTRAEFDNVVGVFRVLLEADGKLKRQFESLSHQACEESGNKQILEPKQEP